MGWKWFYWKVGGCGILRLERRWERCWGLFLVCVLMRGEKDRLCLGKPPDYDVGVSAQIELFDMHRRA